MSMSPERIKQFISSELACSQLEVSGDGQHFEALIVSEAFAGMGLLARHRRVKDILKAHFDDGSLHALSMKTLTAEEWAARQ